MDYLNWAQLDAIDASSFLEKRPYPWVNPKGVLTDSGFERLRETLPDVSRFERLIGVRRSYGQQSHDRFALEWHPGLELAAPWHDFVAELLGPRYHAFLHRLFGRRPLILGLHWHYTPRGCSVSPHCDARRKLGSHIFYFNTEQDWDPAWGGETLVLDDGGRFDHKSAPRFEDFDRVIAAESLGNRSLIFARRKSSWHGVREISCTEGQLRKVFIVTINDRVLSTADRYWRQIRGKRVASY